MMSLPPIAGLDADAVSHFVQSVLKEDLGLGGDVTTDLTIPADARLIATIQTREQIAVAGIDLAQVFFEALDPDVRVERLARDGDELQAGAPIMRVEGRARPMLSAERSALNTLQHLTGIATLTRSYANMIAGTSCILLDTRKTIPGLRAIEKYAARMGGAHNHRMRLDDGILIKDNHVAICGSIEAAVRAAKAGKSALPVQVEVDTIDQIEPALKAGADRLLFDNMSVEMLREGVALVAGRVPIEASGGVHSIPSVRSRKRELLTSPSAALRRAHRLPISVSITQ